MTLRMATSFFSTGSNTLSRAIHLKASLGSAEALFYQSWLAGSGQFAIPIWVITVQPENPSRITEEIGRPTLSEQEHATHAPTSGMGSCE